MKPRTKKLVIVICAAAALAAAGFVLVPRIFSQGNVNARYNPPKLTFDELPEAFIPFDKDEEYYTLNRDVFFSYAGTEVLLSDAFDGSGFNSAAKFFKDYFDTLKKADDLSLKEYYAEDYFEDNDYPEGYSPQRLYDIHADFHSSGSVTLEGETYQVDNYVVKYRIRYNDGTFRNDLKSDVWNPQLYQISLIGGQYRIVNVSYII